MINSTNIIDVINKNAFWFVIIFAIIFGCFIYREGIYSFYHKIYNWYIKKRIDKLNNEESR